MIKTPNVYSNFIKDNVKNKLSYTENFNAYAKENLGIDLDSDGQNFYGENVLSEAKNIYSGYVQDFQNTLGTAKADMSQGITNTANVYKDAIVNYDTQLKQNQNAYGQRKENLASAGLSDSGWEKYIDDNVYAQYVEAVNILNNQSADVYKDYANAYSTTEKRADRALGKQADTLATNVYGQLQGDFNAYKDAYNEDIGEVVKAYSNVEQPTSVEGLKANAQFLDEETYKTLLGNVQAKNYEYYKTLLAEGNPTVYEKLDADFKAGNISESDYSGAHYEKMFSIPVKTQIDYDNIMNSIQNSHKLTDEDKEKALDKLSSIDKNKLPKTDAIASTLEKVKAIDEVAPESNKQTLGLQPGQLEAGDNPLGDLIEKGIEKISNNIAEKKVTTEHSKGDTKYSTIDSSTKYDIANASLTIGENITIKIGDSETKANLRYYAAKSTKEALKGMQAGEIKEHNGYLYLQGKTSLFRLDKSDTKALINAGYFK